MNPDKQPKKERFSIKLELMVPVTITYDIEAIDFKNALLEIEKSTARKISKQEHMNRRIKLKATIYKPHSSIILHTKNYR